MEIPITMLITRNEAMGFSTRRIPNFYEHGASVPVPTGLTQHWFSELDCHLVEEVTLRRYVIHKYCIY